jgi:hypothetical protein
MPFLTLKYSERFTVYLLFKLAGKIQVFREEEELPK